MSRTDSKNDTRPADPTPAAPPPGATPAGFAIPGAEMWSSFVRDQLGRMQAWSDELARMEGAMFDRVRASAADAGRVMNDSIAYAASLSAEWRKLALDAGRRAADLTQARG
jgi:hypothetical protein